MTDAIEAEGLVKRYGDVVALDGLDLEVAAGHRARPARPQRRRQDDHRADPDHAAASRTPAGPPWSGIDVVARRPGAAPGDRPVRAVRRGRRAPHRVREPRHGRPALPPRPHRAAGSGRTSCSSGSTWSTRPTGRRRATPAGCGAGSTWPPRWWPSRRCCSSTSRPPGSTRAAGSACGRSSPTWCAAARRCCSPPSTSRRPTGWPTRSRSSTTAG